jgi:hypothetical protein
VSVNAGSRHVIHRAIRKYGIENFNIECLVVSDKLGNLWEKHLIKRWCTKAPGGYNLTDGGEGIKGRNHSKSTIQKMRRTAKQNVRNGKFNNPMKGKFGSKHPTARPVILTHPSGRQENFDTMKAACIKYDLDAKCLMRVLKYKTQKQTKGFKAYYADLGI